jgi:hypothetical protein
VLTYDIGNQHTVSGSGSFYTWAGDNNGELPDAITVSFTPPAWLGSEPGSPDRYHDVGWVTPLYGSGWWGEPHRLVVSPQYIELVRGFAMEIGYSLAPGVEALIVELHLPPAAPAALMPSIWDRDPKPLQRGSINQGVTTVATTQLWTYTVPAGRRAILHDLNLSWARSQVGSTPGWATAWVYLTSPSGSGYLAQGNVYNQPVGATDHVHVGDGLVLCAGDNIAAYRMVTGDGYYSLVATALFTEFDAD